MCNKLCFLVFAYFWYKLLALDPWVNLDGIGASLNQSNSRYPKYTSFRTVLFLMLDHSRNAKRVSWIQVLCFAFSCQPKLTFNDDRIGCKFVMVHFIFGIGLPAPFQDFLVRDKCFVNTGPRYSCRVSVSSSKVAKITPACDSTRNFCNPWSATRKSHPMPPLPLIPRRKGTPVRLCASSRRKRLGLS